MITIFGATTNDFTDILNHYNYVPFTVDYKARDSFEYCISDVNSSDFICCFGKDAIIVMNSIKALPRLRISQSKEHKNLFFVIKSRQILCRILLIKSLTLTKEEEKSFRWMISFEKNYNELANLTFTAMNLKIPSRLSRESEDEVIYMDLQKKLLRLLDSKQIGNVLNEKPN